MKVDIQPDVRGIAARLGAGAPYALKALAGQLADNPDMGRPSGLPGILNVTIDGDMFENCPDLMIGYIREPDRIEIRFLQAVPSTEPSTDAHDQEQAQDREQDQPADPAAAAVTVRQVADVGVHRDDMAVADQKPLRAHPSLLRWPDTNKRDGA